MLTTAVIEAISPPGPTIDEQLARQIDAAFCKAGGGYQRYTHRKYGADHCPTCQPKLSIAEAAWGQGPLAAVQADIQAALYEMFGGVREGES